MTEVAIELTIGETKKRVFAPFAWSTSKRVKTFGPTKQVAKLLNYFDAWRVDDPYLEKKMNGWKV